MSGHTLRVQKLGLVPVEDDRQVECEKIDRKHKFHILDHARPLIPSVTVNATELCDYSERGDIKYIFQS